MLCLKTDTPHLHQNVVLGQQESGDLGQLAHRGAVCVWDDGAKFVQCVVQIVHAATLARVDRQPDLQPTVECITYIPYGSDKSKRYARIAICLSYLSLCLSVELCCVEFTRVYILS